METYTSLIESEELWKMLSRFKWPRRRDYKTNASYLDAIYRKNRRILDPVLQGNMSKKRQFIELVKEQKQNRHLKLKLGTDKITTKEAVKSVLRLRDFTSEFELGVDNLISQLKGNKQYEELADMVGDKRILRKNFKYDKVNKTFKYKDVNIKFGSYSRN